MKRGLGALLVLAACAHTHAEEGERGVEREHHPCDPKGADVARYVEPEALNHELSPDELALRGKCSDTHPESERPRNPDEASMTLMRDVLAGRRECDGACEPMRASLPALDEKHDLEDETLQRECTAAAGKLDARVRAGCRHVCLVDRRKDASAMIFARTMRGLNAFNSRVPAADEDDAQVRRAWVEAQQPLPPRRFRLGVKAGKEMTAEGAFYPGGPLLRLRLVEGNAGCGQSQWTVDAW